MKHRPLVVVSQRVDVWPNRDERRDALDQRLMTFLLMTGLLPVPVPNGLFQPSAEGAQPQDRLDAWITAINPQGIVLSGGNDVGEFPERDQTERGLLGYAQKRELPLLGICRGMQMLATWAGGRLVPVDGHVRTRHRLLPVVGSGPWPEEVNSFHNLTLGDCPACFTVTARTESGAIEAIRHKSLPWEGWMWHPERESRMSQIDTNRLKALFHV
jgi:gamma-glutamyl-gamma-aminobutyrate hydrolase PuuD